jgi:hypothetical protein
MRLVQARGGSREPRLPWGRALFLAVALSACSAGGLGAYWPSHGLRPDVINQKDLSSFWRQQVYQPDGKVVVVFLGTSCVRPDISLEAVRQCLPACRVFQLGLRSQRPSWPTTSCVGKGQHGSGRS